MKLSIVMPVYNEKDTLLKIINKIASVKLPKQITSKELIIVDDYSTDGTRDLYSSINLDWVNVFFHEKNYGKGRALQTGFEKVTGDIVIIQDADLEYNPNEYNKLLEPILDGNADVVYGSRFVGGESHRILYFWHFFANKMLTLLSNMFSDLNLTDMETCYKVFKSNVIKSIHIEENRFGFEPEITAKVAELARDNKVKLYEVGISYFGRTYEEGKKIGFKDAVRAFWCIFKYNSSKFAYFIKYSFVGLFVALSQFISITLIVEIFKTFFKDLILLENIANIISIELSIIAGFFLHSNLTWRYSFKSLKDFLLKLLLFQGVTSFSLLIRAELFYLLSLIRFNYQLNSLLGIFIAVIINFAGYNWLFKRRGTNHLNI